jgi:D-alanyl-D-alanine carboxypeptidase
MLDKMTHSQKIQILNRYHLAKNEKQKIAKGEQVVENPSQLPQKKSVIAPKAQEPFAKPVPRPQKTDDETVLTGSKLYSLMIPLEDIERLKQAAKDSGQSVSTVIRAAIKNHLIHY